MRPRLFDGFAGAGGVTEGATLAGFDVVDALNHNEVAVATHRANHPRAEAREDNALTFDYRDLRAHDAGHLSPECTWFTDARGGKPGDGRDLSRATAGCTVRYARACRPPAITVENVEEYGASPEAAEVVQVLTGELEYHHWRVMFDAAHCRTPQHRERIFDVFTLRPIVVRLPPPGELVTARAVIDLIGGRWSAVDPAKRSRPLAPRTLRQIEKGREQFGGGAFLVPYYGSKRRGAEVHVRSLDRPIGALTTVDRYAVVRRCPASGDWQIRMLTPGEQARCFGFPTGYIITGTRRQQVHQVGNAVAVQAAAWVLGQVREQVFS